MDIYRVSFIGHRAIDNPFAVEDALMPILSDLLRSHSFVEFQLGHNGDFDLLVAACIKRTQAVLGRDNSAMTLVLPYPVADMAYYAQYYDSVLIPEEVAATHPKGAITRRNRWMVEHTDALIAYVRRDSGGAAACLRMAEKDGITIIRI